MRATLRSIQALILAGLISVLAAQAAGAEVGRITEGAFLWRTAEQSQLVPAPTLKTDVRIVVTGIVARASVRQEFTNPSNLWAEGIYVFPLPEDAAVDHLRMHVGDGLSFARYYVYRQGARALDTRGSAAPAVPRAAGGR